MVHVTQWCKSYISVLHRRVQDQRVRSTLTSRLSNVIKVYMHLCRYSIIHVIIICNSVSVCAWTRELQAKHPHLGQPSQTVTVVRE